MIMIMETQNVTASSVDAALRAAAAAAATVASAAARPRVTLLPALRRKGWIVQRSVVKAGPARSLDTKGRTTAHRIAS